MAKRIFGINPGEGIELSVTNIVILSILALVFIQLFGFLFGTLLGLNIIVGPLIVVLAAGLAAATGVAILKKLFSDTLVTRNDIFAIIVITTIAILLMFFLRDFVPEVFSVQVLELQSMVGFN